MWTYEPYATAPAVASAPTARNGYLTFGVLSNPAKISDAALQSWAAILQQVPDSKLILMARNDDAVRERFLRPFVQAGVDAARISLLSRLSTKDYLETWSAIDMAFDAFPYSGGTTVCDALWQGVPVIAVHSIRPFGGSAATVLHQAGLDDWVVDSVDALTELALRKSSPGCADELRELRQTLRQRLQASPLLDAQRFTRRLEETLLNMWTERQRATG